MNKRFLLNYTVNAIQPQSRTFKALYALNLEPKWKFKLNYSLENIPGKRFALPYRISIPGSFRKSVLFEYEIYKYIFSKRQFRIPYLRTTPSLKIRTFEASYSISIGKLAQRNISFRYNFLFPITSLTQNLFNTAYSISRIKYRKRLFNVSSNKIEPLSIDDSAFVKRFYASYLITNIPNHFTINQSVDGANAIVTLNYYYPETPDPFEYIIFDNGSRFVRFVAKCANYLDSNYKCEINLPANTATYTFFNIDPYSSISATPFNNLWNQKHAETTSVVSNNSITEQSFLASKRYSFNVNLSDHCPFDRQLNVSSKRCFIGNDDNQEIVFEVAQFDPNYLSYSFTDVKMAGWTYPLDTINSGYKPGYNEDRTIEYGELLNAEAELSTALISYSSAITSEDEFLILSGLSNNSDTGSTISLLNRKSFAESMGASINRVAVIEDNCFYTYTLGHNSCLKIKWDTQAGNTFFINLLNEMPYSYTDSVYGEKYSWDLNWSNKYSDSENVSPMLMSGAVQSIEIVHKGKVYSATTLQPLVDLLQTLLNGFNGDLNGAKQLFCFSAKDYLENDVFYFGTAEAEVLNKITLYVLSFNELENTVSWNLAYQAPYLLERIYFAPIYNKSMYFLLRPYTNAQLNTDEAIRPYLWGDNSYGQLGFGHTEYVEVPTYNPFWKGVKMIYTGKHNNSTIYYLDTDNKLWGAGRNYEGQLGRTPSAYISTPVLICENVYDVAVSDDCTTCYATVLYETETYGSSISRSAGVFGWGLNSHHQIIDHELDENHQPVPPKTVYHELIRMFYVDNRYESNFRLFSGLNTFYGIFIGAAPFRPEGLSYCVQGANIFGEGMALSSFIDSFSKMYNYGIADLSFGNAYNTFNETPLIIDSNLKDRIGNNTHNAEFRNSTFFYSNLYPKNTELGIINTISSFVIDKKTIYILFKSGHVLTYGDNTDHQFGISNISIHQKAINDPLIGFRTNNQSLIEVYSDYWNDEGYLFQLSIGELIFCSIQAKNGSVIYTAITSETISENNELLKRYHYLTYVWGSNSNGTLFTKDTFSKAVPILMNHTTKKFPFEKE